MYQSIRFNPVQAFSYYPGQDEIDRWVSGLLERAEVSPVTG